MFPNKFDQEQFSYGHIFGESKDKISPFSGILATAVCSVF